MNKRYMLFENKNTVHFDAPALYQIIVQGILQESYKDYFRGMSIEITRRNSGNNTIITGLIKDQAALAGLLNMLYEFHYSLLSVQLVDNNSESENE